MVTKPFLKTFMTKQILILLVLIICSMGVFAAAIEPIPEEDGFSGRVNVGASWLRVKSNTIAGTRFGDLSNDRIDSLFDEPDSETSIVPLLNGELRYTFADTRTQAFVGNSLDDWIRFDMSTAAGIRKQWDETGIFEGAFLFSAIPTEIWEDPYITGTKREETDRTSTGGRFGWSRIYNSNFHFTYSYRDIDIDDELSGVWLGLPAASQDLLNREGDHHKAEILYVHQLAENQWLAPTFYYSHYGLDGDAMSNDAYTLMLTHTFATEKWRLITNLSYGFSDYDERNPIYQTTQDDDRYGISTAFFYPNLFNVENLTGVLSAAYWLENSNIDFYDTEIIAITASTMYRF
ncbi:MAG: DUF2860 family protein [Planctomycetota bacterium]